MRRSCNPSNRTPPVCLRQPRFWSVWQAPIIITVITLCNTRTCICTSDVYLSVINLAVQQSSSARARETPTCTYRILCGSQGVGMCRHRSNKSISRRMNQEGIKRRRCWTGADLTVTLKYLGLKCGD